ncbi:MAG: methyltransferase domain-containing protein [Deltaproteobacteria bacterium]|nr:methyltransferase domain-containing protein [Deltaproteobacteria bacterium]
MSAASAAAVARAYGRIEHFLDERARGWEQSRALADAARRLSERYTEERAPVAGDDVAELAYLAYFGPRAVCATAAALDAAQLTARGVVVDAGCGSGAAALLLVEAGAARVIGVDRSERALAMARALVGDALRAVCAPVESAPACREATLVASSFAFGELAGSAELALAALERLGGEHSALAIVDAGDRAHARRLQQAREAVRLAPTDRRHLLAPCPHDDACPALARERDWCHARVAKALSPRLAAFARAVGRDEVHMASSYLVLAPPGATTREDGGGILVIGEAHKEKGRARLSVCGPGGLRFLQALKRERAAFDALLAVPRGARLAPSLATGATHGVAHVDASQVAALMAAE